MTEAAASLDPSIAAALLILALSILPLNSLAIVFIGVFTSEASAVVPSETCCGDIRPMTHLQSHLAWQIRLYA